MDKKPDNIIDSLLSGDTVACAKCNEGKYISKTDDISKSHDFYCDKCGDNIHLIPNLIIN